MKIINNVAIWVAILTLLLLGVKADTRSVQRDITVLNQISGLQSQMQTNQEAIISILKVLNKN